MFEDFVHGETLLWVELEGLGEQVVGAVGDVGEPLAFWLLFYFG